MRRRNSRMNNGYVGGARYPLRYTDGYGVITPNKCHLVEREVQDWNRPSYWLPLPVPAEGTQRFVGLVAIFQGASGNTGSTADSNFVSFRCSGNYIVDWGITTPANPNGVTTAHTSNTDAQRQYNWVDVPASTLTPDGYRQVVIQAYPQTGQTLTTVNLNRAFSQAGVATIDFKSTTQWLDVAMSGPNLSSVIIGGSSFTGNNSTRHFLLQRVNMIGHMTSLTGFGNVPGFLHACTGVERITGTNWTERQTDFRHFISGAINIRSLPLLKTPALLTLQYWAGDAKGLVKAPPIVTSKVTNMQQGFTESVGIGDTPMPSVAPGGILSNLPMWNTALITDWSSCFLRQRCIREFPPWQFNAATTLSSTFQNCDSLERVGHINAPNCTVGTNLFNSCFTLTEVEGITCAVTVNLQNLFASCSNLRYAPRVRTPTGGITLSGTAFSSMYDGCLNLISVPAYSFSSTSATFNTMFNNCTALTHLPDGFKFPNNLSGSTLSFTGPLFNTFNACPDIRRATMENVRKSLNFTGSASSGCVLSPTELNRIFTGLGGVTSQGTCTINITNNWGAAACDRSIATAKGWTVTG